MNAYFRLINAFIEDTCVIIAVAYLLARGPMLALLFRERLARREAICLGLVLGMVGLTEGIFPGARFPYATHTLIIAFAAVTAGSGVGLTAAAVVTLGTFAIQAPRSAVGTMLAVSVSALLGGAIHRVTGTPYRLIGGFIAGVSAQACALLTHFWLAESLRLPEGPAHALVSIPANGFGVMLLQLVITDAQIRADSERHRLEAERAHALVVEAQLTALRARVHPHFLFNTLASIAGLCGVAPDKAEAAIIRLGQLMRRALETGAKTRQCLGDELEHVRGYLEIEQQRIGGRLRVRWEVDPGCESTPVPPFAVQTLVENAVIHGIAPKMEPGSITVYVRRYPRHTLIAVVDDGSGMTREARRHVLAGEGARAHGLQILTQQLALLYNRHARLRLLSRPDAGTLAVFIVPTLEGLSVRDSQGM